MKWPIITSPRGSPSGHSSPPQAKLLNEMANESAAKAITVNLYIKTLSVHSWNAVKVLENW
jgi:hypothetical protein